MSSKTPLANVPSLAVNRATLAAARGSKKLDIILSAPDPKAFVRQMPAEDLYFAIRDIGLEDAAEIVSLASPGQFRAFVDLDTWDGDVPDAYRALQWLMIAHDRRNPQAFRAKRQALDHELIQIVLKTFTVIHSLEENDDPEFVSSNFIRTPEGKYVVEINVDGDTGAMVRRLIEDFIDENPFTATRIFESTRWETPGELEESALRWRTGRMRDMGFPELEEALRIWAPPPANWSPVPAKTEAGHITGVPALLIAGARTGLFLDRAVDRLSDDDRPHYNEGLLYLLNCAIVADGGDAKAADLSRDTLTATRDLLSLGLEIASVGDESAAAGILATTPPVELFRFAVGKVLAVARQASTATKPLSFGSGSATILDSPDAETIAGLRKKRPRLYDPAKPGENQKQASRWRAFRTPEDLKSIEAVINRVRAASTVLEHLGVDHATIERVANESDRAVTAVTVSQLLLTFALTGSAAPLPRDRVAALCGLFEAGKLSANARTQLQQWFDRQRPALPANLAGAWEELATFSMSRFVDELGPPCAAGGIEAKFVECLLVAKAEH